VVRLITLGVAMMGTLGLAARAPELQVASGGSEAVSTLLTGAVLLMLASLAQRPPVSKK
jgi:hypothetical protein